MLTTVSLCLPQISSLQDTPELLGFLRNTSAPHQRHKRAATAAQSYRDKTLVSCRIFVHALRKTNMILRCVMSVFRSTSVVSLQNCTNISCLRILCVVGRLDRGQSAVVKVRSRLWARTFLQVGLFTCHLDIFHDLSVNSLLVELFPPQVYYLLSEFLNVFLALFTLRLDFRFFTLIQRLFFQCKAN